MHEHYMERCIELASRGLGFTAPNPCVGCVIVHDERVLGEGWHKQYGAAHAEVEAFASVQGSDVALLPESTVYVSLEPCNHHGKTPPCTDLLIRHGVKRVVIGSMDPNPIVAGAGIQRLRDAGIEVISGVLTDACRKLNAPFFTFHEQHRPFITLKWAESADGFLSGSQGATVHMSNHEADILVHKLRAEHMAILVGGATALNDDPQLTTRLWPGNNPLRIIWDTRGDLPARLRVFDGTVPTWVFTTVKHAQYPNAAMYHFPEGKAPLLAIVAQMRASGIQSVLVEGGALTHKTFLQAGLWDQLVRIQTPYVAGEGTAVPDAEGLEKLSYRVQQVGDNRILHAENPRGTFTL